MLELSRIVAKQASLSWNLKRGACPGGCAADLGCNSQRSLAELSIIGFKMRCATKRMLSGSILNWIEIPISGPRGGINGERDCKALCNTFRG